MPPTSVPSWPFHAADAAAHDATAGRPLQGLIVCPQCNALYARPALRAKQAATCTRCLGVLERGHRLDLDGLLAFVVAALLAFAVALLTPVVEIGLRGNHVEATLPEALFAAWRADQRLVALLTAATVVVFPLAALGLRAWLLVSLRAGVVPIGFVAAMRALGFLSRWSMVEVLTLSAIVSIARIAGLANVVVGPGLFAIGALMFLFTAVESAGLARLWDRADALRA